MPASSTRQRNDEIRSRRADYPSWYTINDVAEALAPEYGLSPITVRNALRGRDLNPPPSQRNRASRRAAGQRQPLGLERRFGVEVEFFGIDRGRVQLWLNSTAFGAQGWRVVSDGSVQGAVEGRHYSGLELVSPPLRGEAGLTQIREALTWLVDNGAKVNRSCGLHVHHEARDLGAKGIARMADTWTKHQGLINWLVSESRRDTVSNYYARPMTEAVVDGIKRAADQGRIGGAHSRYYAVNVASYGRHGTVEIRQHQGTLSFRKIEAWVRLGQGLMDAAVEERAISETGLRGLLAAARVDEDASAFLLGRAMQFGAPAEAVAA